MASASLDIERRAEAENKIQAIYLELIALKQHADRQDMRLNTVSVVAYLAAAGSLLFGLVNFVLLMLLFGRL